MPTPSFSFRLLRCFWINKIFCSRSIILVTLVTANFLSYIVYELVSDETTEGKSLSKILSQQQGDFAWLLRLFVNCFGYACVFLPLYLIYKYTKKIKYVERTGKEIVLPIIKPSIGFDVICFIYINDCRLFKCKNVIYLFL